ncbi:MAG TPA: TPM domain-containing protein [Accumulibacter sp.]|nr:TPM domain-containing protein [Accumulibacter sp.]MCC2867060.1 TPM domain-containing protein [Candidatus Accumulibacter phosphatis]MCM8579496.1 TPM domain-containing protein [Accumulibacter sp.]MCM8624086.1 TPM domain-containing protein [Accumulibacter sp.]MCQ1549969.1 TPM domain-containing protein [Candidatus Accumulibacter phosphatis]HNC21412.1 TPM domain-containing protein [Accumulibacter sp.]
MPSLTARLAVWLMGLWLLVGAGFAGADVQQVIPRLAARVTDLTSTLDVEQRRRLDDRLAAFEKAKGSQIAVLIVPTVQPESVEQYALRVVESWKLGRRGVDDGALLLIAKDDRKLRIEVGYGLEGALNDATAKRIISETIAPRFKRGDFYGGIDAGIAAMMQVIAGEALPPAARIEGARRADVDDHFEMLLLIGFVLVFVVGGVLRAIFGRFLAAGMVGVAAGAIAAMLISSLLIAAVLGVAAALVSLFLGMRGGTGWSSGGISWGGGGGRSSGGFSGGGGSFGGGGASGDW